jgi:hypothetical protein
MKADERSMNKYNERTKKKCGKMENEYTLLDKVQGRKMIARPIPHQTHLNHYQSTPQSLTTHAPILTKAHSNH